MASRDLHAATAADLARIVRVLVATRVFDDRTDAAAAWAEGPWRVQVNADGDVAVLDRWREHLPLLSIEALWCPVRAVAGHVRYLDRLARDQGFAGVVSPAVPVETAHAYEAAGLWRHETVATYQLARRDAPGERAVPPEGVRLDPATPEDLAAVLALDARCFDPFWRFDQARLARHMEHDRLVVARGAGGPVGYTLTTAGRGDTVLGRLCVAPERQREGIGSALLAEAVGEAFCAGAAHITLCTQVTNSGSRALYLQAGFRDTGRRLTFLRSD